MKNKEPLILAIVVIFTLITYYLVEPFAHSVMHKHIESEEFSYKDITPMSKQGDATRGKELVMGAGACTGCHSIGVAGVVAPMDAVSAAGAYGVNPPDLSFTGTLYDANFLADLIKNPAHALKVEHKFDAAKGEMHPMVGFYGAGGDIDQEIADMVAYLQDIAKASDTMLVKTVTATIEKSVKAGNIDASQKSSSIKEAITKAQNQVAYEVACGRCHAMKYENWTQIGTTPKFKHKKDTLAHEIKVLEYQESLTKYMGKLPPDLSMYIRSRGEHYINTFMENPQNYLKGTAMPRVGVNKESAQRITEYLEDSGDTKRHERESLGIYVLGYLFLFALLAFLWKKQVWKELH